MSDPDNELVTAKERYTGLTYKDVVIEPATEFKNGMVLVCIAVRKTGFARVDVAIEEQELIEVFSTFDVPFKTTTTSAEFEGLLNAPVPNPGYLVNRTDTKQVVIIINDQEDLNKNVIELLGGIYFSKVTWDPLPKIDGFYIGDVGIQDPSVGKSVVKLVSLKDYNDSININTVDAKVVSLANGEMTANIYILDKDGNKIKTY